MVFLFDFRRFEVIAGPFRSFFDISSDLILFATFNLFIKLLLSKNAITDGLDEMGDCALTIAAENSDREVLAYLLENISDIHDTGYAGRTALLAACSSKGNSKNIELLIEKGCDLKSVDDEEYTALTLAAQFGDPDMLQCGWTFMPCFEIR